MKRSLILLAIGAALALPLWIAPAPVMAQGKTPVQAERTKLMRSNFGGFKMIKAAKDTASVTAGARTIIQNMKTLRTKFPAGLYGGASRAKPPIFGKYGRYQQTAKRRGSRRQQCDQGRGGRRHGRRQSCCRCHDRKMRRLSQSLPRTEKEIIPREYHLRCIWRRFVTARRLVPP